MTDQPYNRIEAIRNCLAMARDCRLNGLDNWARSNLSLANWLISRQREKPIKSH